MSNFTFTVRRLQKFTIVSISGRVLFDDEHEFERMLSEHVDFASPHLVIQLTVGLELTSYAIGVFVNLWKNLVGLHGSLDIIAEDPTLLKNFTSLNLHRVIKIFSSEKEFNATAAESTREDIVKTVRQTGKYRVVDIKEPFNVFSGFKELDMLLSALFTEKNTFIALNLADIIHIYSEAIGTIIKWHSKLKDAGGQLYLLNLNNDLKSRLDFYNLDSVLELCLSEKELPA